jgi:hypothetical protein
MALPALALVNMAGGLGKAAAGAQLLGQSAQLGGKAWDAASTLPPSKSTTLDDANKVSGSDVQQKMVVDLLQRTMQFGMRQIPLPIPQGKKI